jgi:hypothetical protein
MNRKGQTIVEMALLIPVVIFVFAVLYYMILLVRTEIVLRESALTIASKVAMGSPSIPAIAEEALKLEVINWRWGVLFPPSCHVKEPTIDQWQSYTGFGTVQTQSQMVQVDLLYILFPHAYAKYHIPLMTLHAHCELPTEPTVPS